MYSPERSPATALARRAAALVACIVAAACSSDPWEDRPGGIVVRDDAFLVFSDPGVPRLSHEVAVTADRGSSHRDAGTPLDARSDGDSAAPEAAPARRLIERGAIVITEIMPDPAQVADRSGEWFELHNPGDTEALNLRGCELRDDRRDAHTIDRDLIIAPRGYVVLAASEAGATLGFAPSYGYAGITLANSADEIILTCGAGIVDSVAYAAEAGFPLRPGASLSLDAGALHADRNDDGASWCASEVVYRPPIDLAAASTTAGDRGTPGAPNPPCSRAR